MSCTRPAPPHVALVPPITLSAACMHGRMATRACMQPLAGPAWFCPDPMPGARGPSSSSTSLASSQQAVRRGGGPSEPPSPAAAADISSSEDPEARRQALLDQLAEQLGLPVEKLRLLESLQPGLLSQPPRQLVARLLRLSEGLNLSVEQVRAHARRGTVRERGGTLRARAEPDCLPLPACVSVAGCLPSGRGDGVEAAGNDLCLPPDDAGEGGKPGADHGP